MKIVPFDVAKLDELVAMWRESFEHGVGVRDPHPLAEQRAFFLTSVLPARDVQVAMRGDQLVGFAAFDRASVNQLYVRVGEHRQGIGTALLDAAKARSGGSLWLYTFARNVVAQRFYEKNGFAVVARGFEPSWQLDDIKYEWRASPRG